MSKLSGLNLDLNNLWKLSENLVAEVFFFFKFLIN